MIIVESDIEKANLAAQPTTQLFFARMPEPDVSNLSSQLGNGLRLSEQDAPPAYDLVSGPRTQNVGGSSMQREGMVASGSSARVFESLILHSRGKRLHEGFYLMLPPTDVVPHPFAQREVTNEDWKKCVACFDLILNANP